jgi:hypothetical protein
MQPQKSPYIRDIKPPVAADEPAPAAVTETPAKTELQSDIPVRVQANAELTNNPIASQQPILAAQPAETDQELDQVLKDVNHEVKIESAESNDKKSRLGHRKPTLKSGPQTAKAQSKHVLPIVVAVVVAIALAFLAFVALKNSGGA